MLRRKERNIDLEKLIGSNIKRRRLELKLTLKDIAEVLDISYQQVSKLERGVNYVKASDLPKLCGILKVKLSYFYIKEEKGVENDNVSK